MGYSWLFVRVPLVWLSVVVLALAILQSYPFPSPFKDDGSAIEWKDVERDIRITEHHSKYVSMEFVIAQGSTPGLDYTSLKPPCC